MNIVFAGIGSNIGNSVENCFMAVNCLQQLDGNRIISKSSLYKTEPIGYSEQDWFVNCVVKIETYLGAMEFLEVTQHIEEEFGARTGLRWGPREMDIDILFYNKEVVNKKDLKIPHPMVYKRRFVLAPMAEIEPDFIHPSLHKNIQGLLNDIGNSQKVELLYTQRGHK